MSKVVWKDWDPEAVKAAVLEELTENAEVVGKFVEEEARRRLDAIRTPDDKRSINWRRFLSKYVLRHTIEVEPGEGEIVIRVGMRKSPKKGGNTRGLYVELGSAGASVSAAGGVPECAEDRGAIEREVTRGGSSCRQGPSMRAVG